MKTQRMWQTAEVTTGAFRLRVCNVHLPSERQLGPERAAAQRISEVVDAISSTGASPDVVLGDLNELPGGALVDCMAEQGYTDAAVLSGRAGKPTKLAGGRGDYIWIKNHLGDNLSSYDVAAKTELACNYAGKSFTSDHLPLWITLAAPA